MEVQPAANQFFNLEEFKKSANIQSFDLFEEAKLNREAFWENQARNLHWFQDFSQVLE